MSKMSNLDFRDLSDTMATRLESCFSILDNLEYLCKDVNPDGVYNMNLHDDLVKLVNETLADTIVKLRAVSKGDDQSES